MSKDRLLALKVTSALAPQITEFVAQKRALGYKYNAGVEMFNDFDRFCNEHSLESPYISKELIALWEMKRPNENETTHSLRIWYIHSLSVYLHANGYDAPGAFPPTPTKVHDYVPYIFNEEELRRFFSAVDRTEVDTRFPLRYLIMPVLFRLMYTCGLRVSEVTNLKRNDVDIEQGIMTVYGAKGDKDRMVGISDSMLTYLKNYCQDQKIKSVKTEYLFPGPNGKKYETSSIYRNFRDYLFRAGLPHYGRGKGPRLHDLRHSFAVHVLVKWSNEGKDLYTCLPILSTYLGHTNIYATETYLRLVPDAYGSLTRPFENKFQKIMEALSHEEDL